MIALNDVLKDVLAAIGLVTIIGCLSLAALCIALVRQARAARPYRDEMQEGRE